MIKQSPLIELHRANGAQFVEAEGRFLPLHFGDPLREYHLVRSEVGLFDLCHHSLLSLEGPDRLSFLQGMISNDVKTLAEGEGTYAAFLDIQGKILADTRIFCATDSFLVDLWEPLKEKILTHLNRYLIADDVRISDLTGEFGILSIQGPRSTTLLKTLLSTEDLPLKALDHRLYHVGGAKVRCIRSSTTGEQGCDLLIRLPELTQLVTQVEAIGKRFSNHWVGLRAQELLRIETGIPRYGVDMDESTLLLETGLDRAVSFEKGCYLGQEVVERIRSRGHVNKKLAGMVLEGDSPAGPANPIRAGNKSIGTVTSSILSPALKRPVALGYVHRDYLQPGTPVMIDCNGKLTTAELASLPFYKSSSRLESS